MPVTQWLASEQRLKQLSRDMEFRNEDGDALQFGDLAGKPLAVSFIYTRCDNPNKCARVANTMAQLQNEVEKTGLGNKVHLLLITYDPEHDSPEVLKNYAVAHDLRCNQNTMMLRPDSKRKDKLFDEWQIAVNYNSAGVNIHGLQLLLFDKQGRWVRTYHTLIWDNAKVVEDLNRLASEPAFTRTSR